MARGRLLRLEALLEECCGSSEGRAQHSVERVNGFERVKAVEAFVAKANAVLVITHARAQSDDARRHQHENEGSGSKNVMHES